jgi:hypothetical protein
MTGLSADCPARAGDGAKADTMRLVMHGYVQAATLDGPFAARAAGPSAAIGSGR